MISTRAKRPVSPGAVSPPPVHASRATEPPACRAGTAGGADKRRRLLQAALDVLLGDGVHALSQTRVAAAAGLRQSHLTYYFPTRFDLLKAVVEFADDTIIGMVEGRSESIPRDLDALRQMLVRPLLERRMPRLMLAMHAAAEEDPALHAWMRGFDARMRTRLVAVMESLGLRPSARDFALFHASLIGIAVQAAWRHDEAAAHQARELMDAAFDRLIEDAAATRGRRTRKS